MAAASDTLFEANGVLYPVAPDKLGLLPALPSEERPPTAQHNQPLRPGRGWD
jgi:hypothetical protein